MSIEEPGWSKSVPAWSTDIDRLPEIKVYNGLCPEEHAGIPSDRLFHDHMEECEKDTSQNNTRTEFQGINEVRIIWKNIDKLRQYQPGNKVFPLIYRHDARNLLDEFSAKHLRDLDGDIWW